MDPFAGRRLGTITKADLDGLILRACEESLYLDYKKDLNIDSAAERKEFLRDITSFANSHGGLLVYGMEEARENGKPTGLPANLCGVATTNAGQLKILIEQLIRDGIDESLFGNVEVETISVGVDLYAVLIRIPSSLRAPHMVKLDGDRRYYRRVNTGKEPMTASQIKDIVLQNSAVEDRVRKTLDSRRAALRKLFAGKTFAVLHLIPLRRDAHQLDVSAKRMIQRLQNLGPQAPQYDGGGSGDWRGRHRLEGYELDETPGRPQDRKPNDYWRRMLFFRDGMIELLEVDQLRPRTPNVYRYDFVEPMMHLMLDAGMKLYAEGTLPLPVMAAMSLENISEMSWPQFDVGTFHQGRALPDGSISPDPVLITEISNDYSTIMRPIWDVVWNAGGRPRCEGYGDDGKYRGYSK